MAFVSANRKIQENKDPGLQSGGDDENSRAFGDNTAADFDPTRQVCECVLHVTDSTNSLTIFFQKEFRLLTRKFIFLRF